MNDDYIQNTLKAYDDASRYEQSTGEMINLATLGEFILDLSSESLILDAGCAYGRDTDWFNQQGLNVQGLDLSPSLIARAKELYPGISFKVADVRETGLEDNYFDGVWSNATLLHLNDIDMLKALREFYRVLKPGGKTSFCLKKGDTEEVFTESFSSDSERYFNFKNIDTIRELTAQTSFEEVSVYYWNERETFGETYRDLDWMQVILRKPKN